MYLPTHQFKILGGGGREREQKTSSTLLKNITEKTT